MLFFLGLGAWQVLLALIIGIAFLRHPDLSGVDSAAGARVGVLGSLFYCAISRLYPGQVDPTDTSAQTASVEVVDLYA